MLPRYLRQSAEHKSHMIIYNTSNLQYFHSTTSGQMRQVLSSMFFSLGNTKKGFRRQYLILCENLREIWTETVKFKQDSREDCFRVFDGHLS